MVSKLKARDFSDSLWKLSLILVVYLIVMQRTAHAENETWIDVDTDEHTLFVMRGEKVIAVFDNVAIGRFGTTRTKVTKDDRTPLGRFRIGWINENSRYYRFFGLNYPNLETAQRAFEENRIDEETWLAILNAKSRGQTPPQNTPLGGYIGIHGIGGGDPEVHHQFNWTNGCVALTNEQIDALAKWLKPGVWVNIR